MFGSTFTKRRFVERSWYARSSHRNASAFLFRRAHTDARWKEETYLLRARASSKLSCTVQYPCHPVDLYAD
jgi:hypothetical protein